MEIISELIVVSDFLDDEQLVKIFSHFLPLLVEVCDVVNLKLDDNLHEWRCTSSEAFGWE